MTARSCQSATTLDHRLTGPSCSPAALSRRTGAKAGLISTDAPAGRTLSGVSFCSRSGQTHQQLDVKELAKAYVMVTE